MEPGEEIEALVDELEQIVADAKSPFGGGGQRKIVDAQEIYEILDEIRRVFPVGVARLLAVCQRHKKNHTD